MHKGKAVIEEAGMENCAALSSFDLFLNIALKYCAGQLIEAGTCFLMSFFPNHFNNVFDELKYINETKKSAPN